MIDRIVLPAVRKAAEPFGGVFVHFCGRHEALFERLCRLECVRAIDLGNPESYNPRWVLERCADTGTVLHSRLAAEDGEDGETYVRRVAALARDTGARLALRSTVVPADRAQAAALRDLWHDLTA